MSTIIDLTGMKFDRLTVIERADNAPNGQVRWKCICDCGNEKIANAYDLRRGHTKSCGCLHDEVSSKNGKNSARHGMSHKRLHRIWASIKTRCLNPDSDHYELYMGRGITVCEEWRNSFETFRDWALANGYTDELTIDRIDPNGNYEPANCRWATAKEQQRNRRDTVMVEVEGITKPLREWCEIKGITYISAYQRYKKGFKGNEIFNFKQRKSKRERSENGS